MGECRAESYGAVTLLEADNDFTEGDKAYYIQQFNRVELAITTELAKASPDFSAMQQAVQDASQAVQQIKVQPGQPAVTATNSLAPTISTAAATFNPAAATHLAAPGIPAPVVPVADRAVVPNVLADRLAAVAAQASTF